MRPPAYPHTTKHPRHDEIMTLISSAIPAGMEIHTLGPMRDRCDQSVVVGWEPRPEHWEEFTVCWATPADWDRMAETMQRFHSDWRGVFGLTFASIVRHASRRHDRQPSVFVPEPRVGITPYEHAQELVALARDGVARESALNGDPMHACPGWTVEQVCAFFEAHQVVEQARLEARLFRAVRAITEAK